LNKSPSGKPGAVHKEHFLDLPWRLDECDPSSITERFKIIDRSQTGNIDVTDKGKMEISFVRNLQGQLTGIVREPVWTPARLANWLDSGIHHPDITKPSAIVFISKALDALISEGTPLDVLARNRYDLRRALADLIRDLRSEREVGRYNALFAANAQDFAISAEHSVIFDEATYAPNKIYSGGTKFLSYPESGFLVIGSHCPPRHLWRAVAAVGSQWSWSTWTVFEFGRPPSSPWA
jgi:type III restriction enzyme